MWSIALLSTGVWCVRHYDGQSKLDMTVFGFTSEGAASDWVLDFMVENSRVVHEQNREQATAEAHRAALRDAELLRVLGEMKLPGKPS